MAIYVAVEPPSGDAEKTAFVRDGFTFFAFLLPVFWFLYHRMWIEAALSLAVTLLLGSLDAFGGPAIPLLSLLFAVIVGLEAPALRLWTLRRRGWTERGAVEADSEADAELRYFLDAGEVHEEEAPTPPAVATLARPGRGAVPALGFLDSRGIA